MLTINELKKRLELIAISREKITKESQRLRVQEHRYKKLLEALEECQEDVFDESD